MYFITFIYSHKLLYYVCVIAGYPFSPHGMLGLWFWLTWRRPNVDLSPNDKVYLISTYGLNILYGVGGLNRVKGILHNRYDCIKKHIITENKGENAKYLYINESLLIQFMQKMANDIGSNTNLNSPIRLCLFQPVTNLMILVQFKTCTLHWIIILLNDSSVYP